MKKFAFVANALVLVANALWFYAALGWDAVDDAYISYVYARNVILGHGLTYNPSERVEGFSNFLWTAMMTPIVGLNLDVGHISSTLGVAFGIGVLALVVRFPRRLGIAPIIGWLAALFLAVDGSFALWSVSGLETPMFAFLILLGVFLYVQEQGNFSEENEGTKRSKGTQNFPFSGIVFALAAMTRPEAGAVFALIVAHQVGWRIIEHKALVDLRQLLTRQDLLRAFSFVAVFVPYWLLRWRYYHSFLPNSFYAKVSVGGPIAQIMRGVEHVQQFVGVHLGWWILLPAIIAVVIVMIRYASSKRERRERKETSEIGEIRAAFFGFTLFAAIVLLYGAYIIYVGGDWSVGRFFVPMLAFVYLMIAAGIFWTAQWLVAKWKFKIQNPKFAPSLSVAIGIVLAIALWFASAYNGEYKIFIGGFDAALATAARITAGKWLKQNVPPGTWIAIDAAGQVPYFSELPAIDMFGINDLHIGRMPVANLGSGTPGHEKFDLGYIIARAPKYVVIYGTLFDSVKEYKRANVQWTNNPALEKFLTIYERRE